MVHKDNRYILKILATFFNPLGHLQPIIVQYKPLFQKLCELKVGWDEEISSDLAKEWKKLLKVLEELQLIEISRNVFVCDENDIIITRELHGLYQKYFEIWLCKR